MADGLASLRTESLKVVIDASMHELFNLARLTVDFALTSFFSHKARCITSRYGTISTSNSYYDANWNV